MKSKDWILLAVVGAGAWVVYRKLGQGVAAIEGARESASNTVSDWLSALFGPKVPDPNASSAPLQIGNERYAPSIFIIQNGMMTTPVALSQAQRLVTYSGYTWGKNPALGYFDRIFPPS